MEIKHEQYIRYGLAGLFLWAAIGAFIYTSISDLITYLWFGLPILIGSLLGWLYGYNKIQGKKKEKKDADNQKQAL